MSRPCTCDRFNRNPFAAFTPDQCRLCWLYAHRVEYREFWDAPRVSSGPVCRHLGADTGATLSCQSCGGTVSLKVFGCAVHGSCTVARRVPNVACCATCPDRTPRDN